MGGPPPEQPPPARQNAGAAAGLAPPHGRPSTGATALPCDVAEVIETSCQGCHAREPGLLAPMALVTLEDLRAPAISDPSLAVRELVARRIHDAERPMPPPASRRLTPDELAVLDAFLGAGAPPGTDDCGPGAESPIDTGPLTPLDDIGECYRFQAHDRAVAGDATPFQAPSGEFYSCFYFAVPWPAGSQAISLRSLDTPLTHHWQLYHTVEAYTDGQMTREASSCGFDLREALGVYSHSQEREQRMPEGVGLQLPPPTGGHGILLEVHYYNPGELTPDATGVEVCTAKAPRPNNAGVAVLGPASFVVPAGTTRSVSATCTPAYGSDIHVFRSFPHMHARGYQLDTVIARRGGGQDVLLDVPFDFNNQLMYDTPAVLRPGDQLITTCHYRNDTDRDIPSGFAADEEMCNHFLYAWPAGTVSNGNFGDVTGWCLF